MNFATYSIFVVLLAISCIHNVSSQLAPSSSSAIVEETSNNPESELEPQVFDFAGNLSRWIVERVSKTIAALRRLFELKFRAIRFGRSIYTTENLVFLRRLLESNVRISDWLIYYLPNEETGGSSTSGPSRLQRFLRLLFPEAGTSPPSVAENDSRENEDIELVAEESAQVTSSPSIPDSSSSVSANSPGTQKPFISLLSSQSVNKASKDTSSISKDSKEQSSPTSSEKEDDREDKDDSSNTLTRDYRHAERKKEFGGLISRIMNLDKLIEARRRRRSN